MILYNEVALKIKFPSDYNYDGKIVHELGLWSPSQYKDVILQVDLYILGSCDIGIVSL